MNNPTCILKVGATMSPVGQRMGGYRDVAAAATLALAACPLVLAGATAPQKHCLDY